MQQRLAGGQVPRQQRLQAEQQPHGVVQPGALHVRPRHRDPQEAGIGSGGERWGHRGELRGEGGGVGDGGGRGGALGSGELLWWATQ